MVSSPNADRLDACPATLVDDAQIEGFWALGPDDLQRPPAYTPTGAFLARQQARAAEWFDALDLVEVQTAVGDEWRVLSHAAIETYAHTAALQNGERRYFVSFAGGARRVFECEPLLHSVSPVEIAEHFGQNAAARARDDWDAVVLRMRRVEPS